MGSISWKKHGDTEIGTYLRSRVHEPLVYSKISSNGLEKPLPIYLITDGMPSIGKTDTLANTIMDCGEKPQGACYPRESR
jgi:hypothetical protein